MFILVAQMAYLITLSSTELYSIFQLIVLGLRSAALLFRFTLTALIRSFFQLKRSKNCTYLLSTRRRTNKVSDLVNIV